MKCVREWRNSCGNAFLPTVYVTCDVCNGKRFEKETLEIKYKKKNIYEVLRMTVEEALAFLKIFPPFTTA